MTRSKKKELKPKEDNKVVLDEEQADLNFYLGPVQT